MKKSPEGFSLVELMVVVAILGIIATIAYPQYRDYLEESYRGQAVADLLACTLALERHYTEGFTYVGADDAAVCNANSPAEGEPRYTITYESLTPTGFTIRATPLEGVCTDTEVICIEIDQTGRQIQL